MDITTKRLFNAGGENSGGGGGDSWSLLGNTGTDASINFIGSIDNTNVIFKRNNIERLSIKTYDVEITNGNYSAFFANVDDDYAARFSSANNNLRLCTPSYGVITNGAASFANGIAIIDDSGNASFKNLTFGVNNIDALTYTFSSDGNAGGILQPTQTDGYFSLQFLQQGGSQVAKIDLTGFKVGTGINSLNSDGSTSFANGNTTIATTGNITTPGIIVSLETASTIASFDASKNIKSLSTSTYPSLTELSYVKGVTSAIQTQIDSKTAKTITFNRQTASYTLVASDAQKCVEMNVGSANNLTVNNSVFSAGDQIIISQYGAGQTTFVAGSGVTIRSASGKLKLTGQYSLATLIFISASECYLSGDISA
jgi:hypothetical protein